VDREAVLKAMFRNLRSDIEFVSRAAAEALARMPDGDGYIKDRLLSIAKEGTTAHATIAAVASLAIGWHGDAAVGALAADLRMTDHRALLVEAVRIRARRGETDEGDLHAYSQVAFEREHFRHEIVARDIAEHFAATQRERLTAHLEERIRASRGDHAVRNAPLIGALFLCDGANALAHQRLLQMLALDYPWSELFSNRAFPFERVVATPELERVVEAYVGKPERYREHELYWISKFFRPQILKERFLSGMRDEGEMNFWASQGLVEGWGAQDEDVRSVFAEAMAKGPKRVSEIGRELPLVIEDRAACRTALLNCLRSPEVYRFDHVMQGVKSLGIRGTDEEVVDAALAVGERDMAPLYRDLWCGALIDALPDHPRVRALALSEIFTRDGPIDTIAKRYPADAEICKQLLAVSCPLEQRHRMMLVRNLEAAATFNAAAVRLLDAARMDTEGVVCAEAAMGWVEAKIAHGPLNAAELSWLDGELDAVGPEFPFRRAAGAVGLIVAGAAERFVGAKHRGSEPVRVEGTILAKADDLFLKRILPRWDELSALFGSEAALLERFSLNAERSLGSMHAGLPNGDRLLRLLLHEAPTARHVGLNDIIGALCASAPASPEMRERLREIFHRAGAMMRTAGEVWAMYRACEVFAEHFGSDQELLDLARERLNQDPQNEACAGALSEWLLRFSNDAILAEVSRQTAERRYTFGTYFKVMSAVAPAEAFPGEVERLLEQPKDHDASIDHAMRAIARRIARDDDVQRRLLGMFGDDRPLSTLIPLASVLGRAIGADERVRQVSNELLNRLRTHPMPPVFFDVTQRTFRPAWQMLSEIAG
jgi:hypothetical protein